MINPYESGETANPVEVKSTHTSFDWLLLLTLLPFAGLIIGGIGYFAAAIILENRHVASEPKLTYGQQAGLISAPLCAIMCAMIGLSIGLVILRKVLFGISILIVTGCLGGFAVYSMWSSQIAQYGRDSSEVMLYYPPMSVATACLLLAILTGGVGYKRGKRIM